MDNLPTANLIWLQLVEQTEKWEQRSVGKEAAVGQRHIGHWTRPRPTKVQCFFKKTTRLEHTRVTADCHE